MADQQSSPLLAPREDDEPVNETSPLLANHDTDSADDDAETEDADNATPQSKSWFAWPWSKKRADKARDEPKRKIRWPSIIAIILLAITVIVVMILGFLVPPALKQYAENAAVLEPTGLSIESITNEGVRARIQANFRVDGSRVKDVNSRRIGNFIASIMRKIESDHTTVAVHMPGYENALIGSADVPPLTVNIMNGHSTDLDFVTDLQPGDAETLTRLANDWLVGKLSEVKLTGSTAIRLKSGVFPLGTHDLVESLVVEGNDVPSVPDYKIQHLKFHDAPADGKNGQAVEADASISLYNNYQVSVTIPSLGFEILVPNCDPDQHPILVATAVTGVVDVEPKSDVMANATGTIRTIPKSLTEECPHTEISPLDKLLKQYLNGEDAQIFVRGKKLNESDAPDWIGDVLESVTVPIDFPGSSFGSLVRNFSLEDVDFKLPSPFADPNDPDGRAQVSGTISVLAALPPEMNVDVGVKGLRSDADLYYEGKKMGELNLDHWEKANSTKVVVDGEQLLNVTARVDNVPLNVTDSDVFGDLMQEMLFGGEEVWLDVKSAVDVKMSTVLGTLVIKGVPAEGKIPVNALPGNSLTDALNPQVNDIQILNTSETGLRLQASFNFTNPTPYTASIPHLNFHVYEEGHMIAEAIVRDIDLQLGNISDVVATATWDPVSYGGQEARRASQRLLSDYLSGKNATITFRAHSGTVPGMPKIGEGLSKIDLTLPAPRVKLPGDDEDEDDDDDESDGTLKQHFIRDATFHLFSSTAAFTLASPLRHNTIFLEYINATALYNHTEPVGRIVYEDSIAATPGLTQTPRLPVEWSPGHVGYDKVKEALGGSLKLDAVANVTIRIGNWVEDIVYFGKGIGAKVHL